MACARIGMVLACSFAWTTALSAQVQTREFTSPRCDSCPWTLTDRVDLVDAIGDTALWFGRVSGVAFDGDGHIYLADVMRSEILRVDVEARTFATFGRQGAGPGEFRLPLWLIPRPSHHIQVYDAGHSRFAIFDSTGAYAGGYPVGQTLGLLESVTYDPKGDVYTVPRRSPVELASNLIVQLGDSGQIVNAVVDPDPPSQEPTRAFSRRAVIQWDDHGKALWVSRKGPAIELLRFTAEGVLTHTVHVDVQFQGADAPANVEESDGRVRMTAPPVIGTIGLFILGPGVLVNVALINPQKDTRYDLFRVSDGEYLTSWVEEADGEYLATSDGIQWVVAVNNDEAQVVRYRVQLDPRILPGRE